MIIKQILYGSDFIKQFRKLPRPVKDLAIKKANIFRDNPLHPSLRLHALKGKLSGLFPISITMNYRVIFSRKANGDVIFVSIGKHDIYAHL